MLEKLKLLVIWSTLLGKITAASTLCLTTQVLPSILKGSFGGIQKVLSWTQQSVVIGISFITMNAILKKYNISIDEIETKK